MRKNLPVLVPIPLKAGLLITACFIMQSAFSQCTELIISEYVEGSGNNKAMEIYNPTLSSVNLADYRIVRYSNGSTTSTDSLQLTGTLSAGNVWVIVNGQTTTSPTSPACDTVLQAMGNQLGGAYPDPFYMNGDDALALVKSFPSRIVVDIFGKIGEDPGASWTDVFPYTDAAGAFWTKDHTLQRKASVMQGVTVNPTAFNVTTEWDSLPEGTWTGLGQHTCNCPSGVNEHEVAIRVSLFPNPVKTGRTITITASENIHFVEIVNQLGQVIQEEKINGIQNEEKIISIPCIAAGFYFVKIHFRNGAVASSKMRVER